MLFYPKKYINKIEEITIEFLQNKSLNFRYGQYFDKLPKRDARKNRKMG